MVWLEVAEQFGRELYLDIHNVEPRRWNGEAGLALSGTLGDGQYEGPVLVEVGRDIEVTFVDRFLNESALQGLFARIEPARVERALKEQVAEMFFCVESAASEAKVERAPVSRRRDKPRILPGEKDCSQLVLPIGVREASPVWARRVA